MDDVTLRIWPLTFESSTLRGPIALTICATAKKADVDRVSPAMTWTADGYQEDVTQ